jgi:PHD/YefM family antitoxin component YafN of YafNO toxin-antitoxin module
MIIDSSKIISINKLVANTEEVLNSSCEKGSLYIFDENRPKYVLMNIDEYKHLMDVVDEFYEDKSNFNQNIDISKLLNAIGSKVFVDYYYIFKNDDSPEEKLPLEYTLNSRRSRSSKAKNYLHKI